MYLQLNENNVVRPQDLAKSRNSISRQVIARRIKRIRSCSTHIGERRARHKMTNYPRVRHVRIAIFSLHFSSYILSLCRINQSKSSEREDRREKRAENEAKGDVKRGRTRRVAIRARAAARRGRRDRSQFSLIHLDVIARFMEMPPPPPARVRASPFPLFLFVAVRKKEERERESFPLAALLPSRRVRLFCTALPSFLFIPSAWSFILSFHIFHAARLFQFVPLFPSASSRRVRAESFSSFYAAAASFAFITLFMTTLYFACYLCVSVCYKVIPLSALKEKRLSFLLMMNLGDRGNS